ncbi:DUF6531 domain-containing protein [Nocardia sp. NPDC058058]|uniref:DUF6531 domain-containing protein n=1 Tax=Nocardia sp. NPDC058058 TaxID=3346317 RepID=UPI0036DF725F
MSRITSFWEWIPSWILTTLNFGMAYPDGDEDDLWALADAWKAAAKDLEALIPDMKAATDSTQEFYSGEGAQKAAAEFAKLYDDDVHSMYSLVKGLEDLGERTRETGTEVEYTKIMEATFAGITAYSVIALIAAWPWGSAAVPVALAAGREALAVAAEQGVRQVALQVAKAGLRTAVKPYLKEIAITGLKAGVTGLGLDVGIQSYQVMSGNRDGIDVGQAARTAVDWAAGGAVARGVSPGISKIFGHTPLAPATRGFLSGGLSGLTGGLGMYGADIGWQVGDQLVHGKLDWSKVNTTLSPAMLTAGFGLGAMHGVRASGRAGRITNGADATAPHPSAGKPEILKPVLGGDAASPVPKVNLEGGRPGGRDVLGNSHINDPNNIRAAAEPARTEQQVKPVESHSGTPESRAGTPESRAATNSPARSDITTADHGNRSAAPVDRAAAQGPAENPSRPAAPSDRSASAPASDRSVAPKDNVPGGQQGDRSPSRAGAPVTTGDRPSNVAAAQHDRPVPVERSAPESKQSAPTVEPETLPAEKPSTGREEGPGRETSVPSESERESGNGADDSSGARDLGRAEDLVADPVGGDHRETAFDAASEHAAENSRTPDSTETCGDPVDVATGEFLLPETDLTLPGVLAIVLKRRHRSNYRFGRWFGPSWSATLDMRLLVGDRGVTLIAEDGVVLAYPHPTLEESVVPVAGALDWTLTRTDSGGYRVWAQERELGWQFEPASDDLDKHLGIYPIAAIIDRHHNQVRFHYDSDGNPLEITHTGGYRVRVRTAGRRIIGLAVVETGSDTYTPVREFDYHSGELAAVVNGVGGTTRYTYDDDHRMLSWTDSNGNYMVNTYDRLGRVVGQRGIAGVLDAEFEYAEGSQGAVTVHTDSVGARTTYGFDSKLRLRDLSDPLGGRTQYAHTAAGKPSQVIAPDGATTHYVYTDDGDIASVTRPDGRAITLDYIARQRPIRISDVDGTVQGREWDERGDLVAVIASSGARTEYTYHPSGAIATITDPNGAVTHIDVDPAGLPVRIAEPSGAVTSVARDGFGRPIRTVDPLGGVTVNRWSPDGKLLHRSDADGTSESWTFDGEGNLLTHTNAANATTSFSYGAFDQLAAHTDPTGATTNYVWDTELRQTGVQNPNGQTWHYHYDLAGRLVSQTDYTGATTRYGHDIVGRTVSVTPATGITRHQTHDILGRLVGVATDAGDWIAYAHDSAGRLVSAIKGQGEKSIHTLTFGYTATGRLNGRQVDGQAPMLFEYDGLGRRIRRTTPSGAETRWAYDDVGRASNLSADGRDISFTYDQADRLTRWQVGELAVDYTHDAVGRVVRQDVIAHPVRLLNLDFGSNARPAPQQLRSDEYTWRPDGYLTAQVTHHRDVPHNRRDYQLDPMGRITTLTRSDAATESYTYDSLSNITSSQIAATQPTSSLTQPHPQSESPGGREYHRNLLIRAGRTRYHYDESGRLIRKTTTRLSRKPDIWHFRYNSFDELTDVWTPDRQWWHYTYDALGRRTTKQHLATNGDVLSRAEYTWDGTTLIEESTGETILRWQYRPDDHAPLTQSTDQAAIDREFYAVITDLIGSPVELVDPNTAQPAATATADLWGTTTWHGRASTALRFPGQFYDSETGFHYNLHRVYDPSNGRFLTQDPLGLAPAPNPNTYPHNPTTWIDPLGLACKDGKTKIRKGVTENLTFGTRQEALDAAYDRAGVPRGTEPTVEWEVGNDPKRRDEDGYVYSEDEGAWGRNMQFETDQGSRIIAEHTSDPNLDYRPHFHAGQPKTNPSLRDVNFGWDKDSPWERFSKMGGRHHLFYENP